MSRQKSCNLGAIQIQISYIVPLIQIACDVTAFFQLHSPPKLKSLYLRKFTRTLALLHDYALPYWFYQMNGTYTTSWKMASM